MCLLMNILVSGHNAFISPNVHQTLFDMEHDVYRSECGKNSQLATVFLEVKDRNLAINLGAKSSTTHTDVDQIMTQNIDLSIWFYEQRQIDGANNLISPKSLYYCAQFCRRS